MPYPYNPMQPPMGALAPQSMPMMDSRMMGQQAVPDPRQLAALDMRGQMGPPLPNPMTERPGDAFRRNSQQLRGLYPDPNQKSAASHIGSALLPALFAGLVGGNMRDAVAYGIGSAAFNYRSELDNYKDMEARILQAGAKIPQEEADYELTKAQTANQYASAATAGLQGDHRIGTPSWQTFVQLGFPGLQDPLNAEPEEVAKAFSEWVKGYTADTTAPKLASGPFRTVVVDGNGGIVYETPGPLSPSGIEASVDKAGGEAGAAERYKLNETQYDSLMQINYDMIASKRALDNLYTKIKNGPETGPISEWQALVDPELQELSALFNDATFAKVGQVKASGVSFGQMTIAEWTKLDKTVSQLKNSKKANLAIVAALRDKLDRQLYENDIRLRNIPQGSSGRPPAPAVPPPATGGAARPSGSRLIIIDGSGNPVSGEQGGEE